LVKRDSPMGYRIAFFDIPGRNLWKEALPEHPNVDEVHFLYPYKMHGFKEKKEIISKDYMWLMEHIEEYDLIFILPLLYHSPGAVYFSPKDHNSMLLLKIEEKRLWNKTIIWDFADEHKLNWEWGYDRCLVYFKNNWFWGKETPPPKLYPLNFAVMDLYVDLIPIDLYQRDIDIGCYFGWNRTADGGCPRGRLVEMIKNFEWEKGTFIDLSYTTGKTSPSGHNLYGEEVPILPNGQPNWWYIYMGLLRRTKILFTSSPSPYRGDAREGEALASGALVFMSNPVIPMPHPFEHGKHLFRFDASEKESIHESLELAKEYLKPSQEEKRNRMAKACWEHATTYHRCKNYVDYAMNIIERHLNG